MNNPFASVGHYLENLGKALFGQLKVTVVQFLHQFAQDKLGQLAIDAVNFASTQASGKSGDALKAVATQKLKDDLTSAGHDITNFATSDYNFLLESALQKVKADAGKGIVALTDATAAK